LIVEVSVAGMIDFDMSFGKGRTVSGGVTGVVQDPIGSMSKMRSGTKSVGEDGIEDQLLDDTAGMDVVVAKVVPAAEFG
jgi:hypothetical protein